MKVWIEGDAGYPDGFAGGMISRDYPQLGMQGIVADAHISVAGGQTLNIPLPPDTLGIVANQRAEAVEPGAEAPAPAGAAVPLPADGMFKWTAPGGAEVTVQEPGADVRYSVVAGQTLTIPLPSGTRGIVVNSGGNGRGRGGRGGGGGGAAGHGAAAARRRTTQMAGPRHGEMGACFCAACLSQFTHTFRQS